MRIPGLLIFSLLALMLAGCGSPISTRQASSFDGVRRIFVERRLNDNNHMDAHIVAALRRLGREATSGYRTMMPQNVDAVLTYDARWEWDFRTYLIECNFELRTAYSNKKIAESRYYRASPFTSDTETIVRELLEPLFTHQPAKTTARAK
jgi:hypothetical protein